MSEKLKQNLNRQKEGYLISSWYLLQTYHLIISNLVQNFFRCSNEPPELPILCHCPFSQLTHSASSLPQQPHSRPEIHLVTKKNETESLRIEWALEFYWKGLHTEERV